MHEREPMQGLPIKGMAHARMLAIFTPLSTVFQSYWENGSVILKDCVQWNPFTVERFPPAA